MLTMPVNPMLAAPTDALLAGNALLGGCWYEPKFDGYRALIFVDEHGARVQSRRGHDITSAFPDIAEAAAAQLKPGTVLDGELLIWVDSRPTFADLRPLPPPQGGRSHGKSDVGRFTADIEDEAFHRQG